MLLNHQNHIQNSSNNFSFLEQLLTFPQLKYKICISLSKILCLLSSFLAQTLHIYSIQYKLYIYPHQYKIPTHTHTMLEQQCQQCGSQYDYFTHTATIVCPRNHVLCRQCANKLSISGRGCSQCGVSPVVVPTNSNSSPIVPIASTNPYSMPADLHNKNWNQPQNYNHQQDSPVQNGHYWQPVSVPSNQGFQPQRYQPQTYPANQGFNPVPQPYQPIPARRKNPAPLCCAAIFFIIIASFMLSVRVRMNTCQYWNYTTCYIYQYSTYECCPNYSFCNSSSWQYCYYLTQIQDHGAMTGLTIGVAVLGAFALIMFVKFVQEQKDNRDSIRGVGGQLGQADYVRI